MKTKAHRLEYVEQFNICLDVFFSLSLLSRRCEVEENHEINYRRRPFKESVSKTGSARLTRPYHKNEYPT